MNETGCDCALTHQYLDTLRAEITRLTLAASESARTLQVRIAELEAGERHCDEYHGELADQVTALREALQRLYSETADYITINHLGDVHHNDAMKMARAALALPQDGA